MFKLRRWEREQELRDTERETNRNYRDAEARSSQDHRAGETKRRQRPQVAETLVWPQWQGEEEAERAGEAVMGAARLEATTGEGKGLDPNNSSVL